MDKDKTAKKQPVPSAPAKLPPLPNKGTSPAAAAPGRVPPLFRRIDWFTALVTFAIVGTVYFLTLAPQVTLEDSGELCTGSYYAGIPHPPGYPFWAIYSWVWTKILPIGNVAWRVEVGEALAAAFACGLVALMVSRGSSMLMEGIEDLKSMTGKWEAAICSVSGAVAGLVLGLGGVMWSESVAINRISLFGVPWIVLVLACLMRWIYAPHQRRYLYVALFAFGICATIHQTLLVAAMGIEGAIIAAQPKLGRDVLFGNCLGYIGLLLAYNNDLVPQLLEAMNNPIVKILFHVIGTGSIVGCIVLTIRTKAFGTEWLPCLIMLALWAAGASFYFYEAIAGMTDPPMQWGYPRTVEGFFHALSRGQYEKANPTDVVHDPGRFIMQLGMLVADVAGEFNWVLVFVAIVPFLFFLKLQKRERAWLIGLAGIYGCIGLLLAILMNPSPDRQSADLIKVFFTSSHAVLAVLVGYGLALTAAYMATHYQTFRVVGLMVGVVTLVPGVLALYNGVDATFFGGLGWFPPLSVIRIFLCLTIAFVFMTLAGQEYLKMTRGQAPRDLGEWLLFIVYAVVALTCLGMSAGLAFLPKSSLSPAQIVSSLPKIFAPGQYSLPVIAGLMIFGIVVIFVAVLLVYRQRAPLAITLALFAVMPIASGLSHWARSEQRGHWFGYWFGHDMFTPPFAGKDGKPLYPEMAKDTILFGGTDPGRFCPTYMIFCESFIPHDCQPEQDQKFDRRDVYLITQNALADHTYLWYLSAQYFRSNQIDPPFFSELARTILKDKDYQTNALARLVTPLDTFFEARGARVEKRWRTYTSWFDAKEFKDVRALAAKLCPSPNQDPVSQWISENLSSDTKALLNQKGDDSQLASALSKDLNQLLERELVDRKQLVTLQREKETVDQEIADGDTSGGLRQRQEQVSKQIAAIHVDPLFDSNRFAGVEITDYLQKFIAQNPQSDTRIRLNRLLLEAAYPKEIVKSLGGVYPDREIYIPTEKDSERCFKEYINDASARLMHDKQFPTEPHQVKPGEGVAFDEASGKVQVSGQIAVMAINGLLTKVIFDQNPGNEFYVEESFPLDWMYPHLTPFGVIMKINRHPLPEITDDVVRTDHEFWTQYSNRLIGNWITYDTSVKEIVDWIEKTYLRHDYSGFKGDRRFLRDDQAQKSFSKLRSSIGGIYAWRIGMAGSSPTPPEYLPKSDAERKRMVNEADFAFRQAFAYCPYSPEAVIRYIQLLTNPSIARYDDALLVAETCHKLDPENQQITDMVNNLRVYQSQPNASAIRQIQQQINQLENALRTNPDDFQKTFDLAANYLRLQEVGQAMQLLDGVLANPRAPASAVFAVVQAYVQLNNIPKVTTALERYVQVASDQPEAWYDLARARAALGRAPESLQALRQSLDLSAKRLAQNPKARDMRAEAAKDATFNGLRDTAEFKALMSGQK